MFNTGDIHTVSDFNRKSAEHISRLKDTKRPEILTVNGKPAVVVQDAAAYEEMAKLADMMDSVTHIKKALEQEGRPIEEFFAEFEKKHGIGSAKIQD